MQPQPCPVLQTQPKNEKRSHCHVNACANQGNHLQPMLTPHGPTGLSEPPGMLQYPCQSSLQLGCMEAPATSAPQARICQPTEQRTTRCMSTAMLQCCVEASPVALSCSNSEASMLCTKRLWPSVCRCEATHALMHASLKCRKVSASSAVCIVGKVQICQLCRLHATTRSIVFCVAPSTIMAFDVANHLPLQQCNAC